MAQPDVTHYAAVKPLSMDPSNNSQPNIFDDQPMYAEVRNLRHSGVLLENNIPNNVMIVEPNFNNSDNDSSTENRNLANNTVMVSPIVTYSGGDDNQDVGEMDNFRDSQNSLMAELPSHVETEAVTWSRFDHQGGRLTLPESGVSLLIPEGAIRHGHSEEIYMAVCRDDKDRPRLSGKKFICVNFGKNYLLFFYKHDILVMLHLKV